MVELKELQRIYGVVKDLRGDEADHYVQAFKDANVLGHLYLPSNFGQATTTEGIRTILALIEDEIAQEEGKAYVKAQKQLNETFGNMDWTLQALSNMLCMMLDVPNIDISAGIPLDTDGTPLEDEHFQRLSTKYNAAWAGKVHFDQSGKVINQMDFDVLSAEEKKQLRTSGYFFINTVSFGSQQIYEDAEPFIHILLERALEKYPNLSTRLACELYSGPNGEGKFRPYRDIVIGAFSNRDRFAPGITDQLNTGLIQNQTHLNIALLEYICRNPFHISFEYLEPKELEPYLIFADAAKNDAAFKSLFLEQELSTYRDSEGKAMKRVNDKGEIVTAGNATTAEHINYLKSLATSWRERMVQRLVRKDGDNSSLDNSKFVERVLRMAAEDYKIPMSPVTQAQTSVKDQPKNTPKSSGEKNTSTQGGEK